MSRPWVFIALLAQHRKTPSAFSTHLTFGHSKLIVICFNQGLAHVVHCCNQLKTQTCSSLIEDEGRLRLRLIYCKTQRSSRLIYCECGRRLRLFISWTERNLGQILHMCGARCRARCGARCHARYRTVQGAMRGVVPFENTPERFTCKWEFWVNFDTNLLTVLKKLWLNWISLKTIRTNWVIKPKILVKLIRKFFFISFG